MTHLNPPRVHTTLAAIATAAAFGGCASEPAATTAPAAAGTAAPASAPVAVIDGRVLDWRGFGPLVAEASGGPVLEEVVLEWRCASECAKAGIAVSADLVLAEERRVLETLDQDPDRAMQLLQSLKARQGLGPLRWQALLRRNAMLRALVAQDIVLDEAVVEQARDALVGARRDARLIVVADLVAAERVRQALRDGAAFPELAARMSLDASAPRGGLVTGVTRRDAGYPSSFREALFTLAPNAVSDPLLVEDRFMIVQMLTENMPPAIEASELDRRARERARIAQERVAMERLADRLLRTTSLSIFDEATKNSLDRMRTERAR
ncbi:MAG: peptidylprolyl isomerase [Phycisphaerae bacterium]|nr:peptidylprolyl isomerase [Phycisphaerae bacterium]